MLLQQEEVAIVGESFFGMVPSGNSINYQRYIKMETA